MMSDSQLDVLKQQLITATPKPNSNLNTQMETFCLFLLLLIVVRKNKKKKTNILMGNIQKSLQG